MTRSIFAPMLSVLALILMVGCTHNNGDIGPLFGQWKVVSIESDGQPLSDYQGDIFISFQSGTVEVKQVLENHEAIQGFGTWSMSDDVLHLNFPDADRLPPTASHFSAEEWLQVVSLSRSDAVLRSTNVQPIITYTLKKW